MNANVVRYWESAERDALKQLDAAKNHSALKAASRELMRARRMLLQLTGENPVKA